MALKVRNLPEYEAAIGVAALNLMPTAGRPEFVRRMCAIDGTPRPSNI
jgi:hypothetical protein